MLPKLVDVLQSVGVEVVTTSRSIHIWIKLRLRCSNSIICIIYFVVLLVQQSRWLAGVGLLLDSIVVVWSLVILQPRHVARLESACTRSLGEDVAFVVVFVLLHRGVLFRALHRLLT